MLYQNSTRVDSIKIVSNEQGAIIPILVICVFVAVALIGLQMNSEIYQQGEQIRVRGFEQTLYLIQSSIHNSFLSAASLSQIVNDGTHPGNVNLKNCFQGISDCRLWTVNPETAAANQIVVFSPAGNLINDSTIYAGENYGVSTSNLNCNGGLLCNNFEIQRGICNNFGTGSCLAQFKTYFVPVCPPVGACMHPTIRLRADLIFAPANSWVINPSKFSMDVPFGP